MTEEEFKIVGGWQSSGVPYIMPGDIGDGDRTLLYGYDVDRLTWHLYFKDSKFCLVRFLRVEKPVLYNFDKLSINRADEWMPNKRVYPEGCDFRFCKVLKSYGVFIPFTKFGTLGRRTLELFKNTGYYGITEKNL